jgi:hypothetical protein
LSPHPHRLERPVVWPPHPLDGTGYHIANTKCATLDRDTMDTLENTYPLANMV